MDVILSGSSPSAITAGIMLLTHARQVGFRVHVAIVGDPRELTPVRGPALLYAPVLASCGVGREHGTGATVVLPGPPGEPLRVTVNPHGVGGWFLVDRAGEGAHPATQAWVRLGRDSRVPARRLARDLQDAIETLGLAPEPAVLDVLFGAPVPALLRLALALRAGRAMSGGRGESITRFLSGGVDDARDPLDPALPPARVAELLAAGELRWVLDRVSPTVRDRVDGWIATFLTLARDDGGRDLALLAGLAEVASHLAQLPVHSILPPLGAAEDSVATALKAGLTAEGDGDANAQLAQVYRFLGGRFVPSATDPLVVSTTPPPASEDPVALWQWFSQEARVGRKRADALWEQLFPRTEA